MTSVGGPGYFRAIAVDFDGTLTDEGRLAERVATAIDSVRATGVRVVLVTGRIMSELLAACPDIVDHVDLVVAENGAVLHDPDAGVTRLARPVDVDLCRRLDARGLVARRGEVIVAMSGADEADVVDEVARLGTECQLIRNRNELMVVPPGVNKGTGLEAALARHGLSSHNTLALGDAENDHSLFEVCELGVAVADAVPSLRQRADLVLSRPDGEGVAELLESMVDGGESVLPRSRRRLVVGHDPHGTPVLLPSARLDVLVAGGSGSGKSYVAGMMAEQLIRQGYSLVVVDPEGDHLGLADLPGVAPVGGRNEMPSLETVMRLVAPGRSVVIDLSHCTPLDAAAFTTGLWPEIEGHRARNGLPHWVIVDEAQRSLGDNGMHCRDELGGHVFVSWQADQLPANVLAGLDVVIAVGDPADSGSTELAAAVAATSPADVRPPPGVTPPGVAVALRWSPGAVVHASAAPRSTAHRRHRHKYTSPRSVEEHRFQMWSAPGPSPAARFASNLGDLEVEISLCPTETVAHHARRGDFSRWVRDVLGNDAAADRLAHVEADAHDDDGRPATEAVRVRLLGVLQDTPFGE